MSVAFMRPVRAEDFDQILELAKQSGGGMTNLPTNPEALRARVDFAVENFTKNPDGPNGETYMLVLEEDGKLLGTSAVFSAIGLDHGFVNFRINKTIHVSKQLKKRVERRLLVPTHDFTGYSEVGSLFLSPMARGGGLGKLLARARYLFVAQHRELVADPICAEMRGWRGPNGEQPFWDALGQVFFDMEYEDADAANAANGNQFISDLLPRHPIYVALLPEAARECLGKPHDGAAPALNMLLKEGFEFRDYVDVFDAGPVVEAKIDDIKTVKESRIYRASIGDPGEASQQLIAAGRLETFRVVRGPAKVQSDQLIVDSDTATALGVKDGDDVRAVAW